MNVHNGATREDYSHKAEHTRRPGHTQGASRQPCNRRAAVDQPSESVEGATDEYHREFPDIFNGLGKMEGPYTITLKENAQPFAVNVPRRVALPLMEKTKRELKRMEALGVISKVEQPTDWCAPMVVVPKSQDDVRICVDLTKLNESVRRERYEMPSVDYTLGQLAGAKIF